MKRYLAGDERTGQGSWQRTYYHQDHLGSTRALSAIDSGTLFYEPFGSLVHEVGATEEHKHRFTGKPLDGTGLYYYGARFYDPELGRFISMDPARGGPNWYVYATNNPLKYIDPSGYKIELSSNATKAEKNAYERVIAYLQTSETAAALMKLLMDSSQVFTIVFNDKFADSYNPSTRTINWDPTGSLVLGDRKL